jgi:hypothetical protein
MTRLTLLSAVVVVSLGTLGGYLAATGQFRTQCGEQTSPEAATPSPASSPPAEEDCGCCEAEGRNQLINAQGEQDAAGASSPASKPTSGKGQ